MIIRSAVLEEIARLEELIAASARLLSIGHYDAAQTEAAIEHVFGVDSELVNDGTYLVAEIDREIVGCGGWSKRATLFGGDRYAQRSSGLIDPATGAAKIRAFFVDPRFARAGIGSAILDACEAAAIDAGFTSTELMATLPGVPFYAARGYVAQPAISIDLEGVSIDFVPMLKTFQNSIGTATREAQSTVSTQ